MIGDKMKRGAGQGVYRIPENNNKVDEGGQRGHVTE
jgi:hypothetical protein